MTARDRYDHALTAAVPQMLSAVGSRAFGPTMLQLVNRGCAADHCSVFNYSSHTPTSLVSTSLDGTDSASNSTRIYLSNNYWKRDEALHEARGQYRGGNPAILKVDIRGLADHEFADLIYRRTNIAERIVIYAESPSGAFGVSVLREETRGPFSENEFTYLEAISETILAGVSKHVEIHAQIKMLRPSFKSLAEIEACISKADAGLTTREAQVCARILYGLFTKGIALDLEIGEESVMTYRKRAFERLKIAGRHELLIWYLELWHSSHAMAFRI